MIGLLRTVSKLLASCFNLNMKEWVLVKGRIKVVPSNSVSTSKWYQPGTKT